MTAQRPAALPIRRAVSLRSHLLVLVAATLLPMLLMGLLAIAWTRHQGQQAALDRLQSTASTLARVVDKGIDSQQATMQQLLASTDTRTATGTRHAGTVVMPLSQARQHYGLPEDFIRRLQSGPSTQVSDVFFPPGQKDPWVASSLSLTETAEPMIILRPSNELITLLPPPPDERPTGVIALVDSQGKLAARSVEPERWLGKRVPDWDKLVAVGTSSGHLEAMSQEGTPIVFAFQKLQSAPGWALAVGETREQLSAAWIGPLRGLMFGGVVALCMALLASQLLSRRILQPLRLLAERSRLIANGYESPPLPPASGVHEFEMLRKHLQAAETALEQRAADAHSLARALERNQRRYRTVAEAGALVFWESDHAGALRASAGWFELTGQTESDALGRGWQRVVHPEDLEAIAAAWAQSIADGSALDLEFRLKDTQARWHWVRARGAQVGEQARQEWAGVLEDVHLRRQTQDELAWLAHHDTLTGLSNRAHFYQQLERALEAQDTSEQLAVLCLDLDRFKDVNDSLGHATGDALLRLVAHRLRGQLRASDILARLGGDEFALLMVSPEVVDAATALADRIVQEISAPFRIDTHDVSVGVSVGICVAAPGLDSPAALMQGADVALYAAKGEGRGDFRFYTPAMGRQQQDRHQNENAFRLAIAQHDIKVFFQPQYRLDDGQLTGWESQLRWHHPERGWQVGTALHAMAQDIGALPALTHTLLLESCRQAASWPSDLSICIPLPAAILHPALIERIEQILSETGVSAERLYFSIPESDMVAVADRLPGLFPSLLATGAKLVVSDFGTGHSTLSMMQRVGVTGARLHPHYVEAMATDTAAMAMLDALIQFCRRLGVMVILDGVDQGTPLDALAHLQDIRAQGPRYGSPVTVEDLRDHMAAAGR